MRLKLFSHFPFIRNATLVWLTLWLPFAAVGRYDAVVLAGDRPLSGLIVTPLVAQQAERGVVPHLLAVDSDNLTATVRTLRQVGATNILHLGPLPESYPAHVDVRQALANISPDLPLFPFGLSVAKLGWKKPHTAVFVHTGDYGLVAQAAALAAHLRAPLIPFDKKVSTVAATFAVRDLGLKRVLLVVPTLRERPVWFPRVQSIAELLTATDLERRLIEKLGAKNIRNLVVIGPPEGELSRGGELAAYYSLRRGSPVVFAKRSQPAAVEMAAWSLIEKYQLSPRTITLLGTEFELPGPDVRFAGRLPESVDAEGYAFVAEPLSVPKAGRAVAFGVGRLHFASIEASSQLLARTFHRERHPEFLARDVIMIANPNAESALPLAETTARITVQDFRNTRVPIQEFYGVPANDQKVRDAARLANIILYQGHSSDQHVLETASPFALGQHEDLSPTEFLAGAADALSTNFQPEMFIVSERGEPDVPPFSNTRTVETPREDFESLGESDLLGLPFVFLQSCNSMASYYIEPYFARGAVAVVGSVTSIHSGSGSAYARAYSHALLYQTNNAGEALRFAKNYLLAMLELKRQRGHQHLHPGWRIAHSFRLYGDPEHTLISADLLKRKRRPVRGQWADDGVQLHVPAKRFSAVSTSKYSARMLPGTLNGGIVRSVKGSERREVMPFQFFTLPLTNALPASLNGQALKRAGDRTYRSVHLPDELDRTLYVLHFPRREPEGKFFKLRFEAPVIRQKKP